TPNSPDLPRHEAKGKTCWASRWGGRSEESNSSIASRIPGTLAQDALVLGGHIRMDFQQAGFPTASGLAQQGTLTLAHYILARPRLTLRFPTLGSWAQKNKYESHFPLLAYH